ncbi:hypothetical protein E1262_05760 [Jiangella aurantiaca]|uniref:Uncharacterized protein n=1 Tax=Jiangella aurantiaca TaxID=2530373 RepID=A0A4R5AN23_9ACTN|nr:hypothetical protein [Jiangella aurantiaca]TDD71642.1 hypothetical protein E1262_05760 [Jiangella aurantiaca]
MSANCWRWCHHARVVFGALAGSARPAGAADAVTTPTSPCRSPGLARDRQILMISDAIIGSFNGG